ncbi:MAG: hypothetical protein HOH66_07625 [Rhodospirillaceae bacterium]|jgi:protein ImuA|nr:hypothetical protein [Rhodospirillaceae bacterium]MBT6117721.1 hypothetical protein [Rhodospirillaceae bacterium]
MNIESAQASPKEASIRPAALREVFADSRDGSATGFVVASLADATASGRPLLWVQDRQASRQAGIPSANGLAGWGVRTAIIRVQARNAADLLWTMEEGLRCAGLAAVVGEVWGAPAALDFTATKRLVLRAEESGVPAYLLRISDVPTLSAAHERWHARALPSAMPRHDRKAPGPPRWALDLFRARWRRPGRWEGQYDRAAHRLDLAAPFSDGAVAAGQDDVQIRAMR